MRRRTAALGALAIAAGTALVVVVLAARMPLPKPGEQPDGDRVSPPALYDPVAAGESTPQGFRQLLPRDGIRPIYDPDVVDADAVSWEDDTLVVGVAIGGKARAYPVRALSEREMVNDRLGGTPILASW